MRDKIIINNFQVIFILVDAPNDHHFLLTWIHFFTSYSKKMEEKQQNSYQKTWYFFVCPSFWLSVCPHRGHGPLTSFTERSTMLECIIDLWAWLSCQWGIKAILKLFLSLSLLVWGCSMSVSSILDRSIIWPLRNTRFISLSFEVQLERFLSSSLPFEGSAMMCGLYHSALNGRPWWYSRYQLPWFSDLLHLTIWPQWALDV